MYAFFISPMRATWSQLKAFQTQLYGRDFVPEGLCLIGTDVSGSMEPKLHGSATVMSFGSLHNVNITIHRTRCSAEIVPVLNKHHAMNMYGEWRYSSTHS